MAANCICDIYMTVSSCFLYHEAMVLHLIKNVYLMHQHQSYSSRSISIMIAFWSFLWMLMYNCFPYGHSSLHGMWHICFLPKMGHVCSVLNIDIKTLMSYISYIFAWLLITLSMYKRWGAKFFAWWWAAKFYFQLNISKSELCLNFTVIRIQYISWIFQSTFWIICWCCNF